MRLLLDTHVLVWATSSDAEGEKALSPKLAAILNERANDLYFSSASIWEIAVKASRPRTRFSYDASAIRGVLLQSGYVELPIDGRHGAAAGALPPIHKDPFDRIILAQAAVEGMTLLTRDRQMLRYPGLIIAA